MIMGGGHASLYVAQIYDVYFFIMVCLSEVWTSK